MSLPLPGSEPRTVGPYEIERLLGEGGVASTWLARDTRDGSIRAIKELQLLASAAGKQVELFERECSTLKELRHRQIPQFIETVIERRSETMSLFLIQEFIDGRSLQQILDAGVQLSAADTVAVMRSALVPLGYLHDRLPPLYHRDIKPSNVLIRRDGTAVLVDFGAVREALADPRAGGSSVVGTFGYMAPEQFQARAYASTDLYALGAMAVHLVTGIEPSRFEIRRLKPDFHSHMRTDPHLAAILDLLLEPAAEDRYRDVHALRRALDRWDQRFGGGEPTDARLRGLVERTLAAELAGLVKAAKPTRSAPASFSGALAEATISEPGSRPGSISMQAASLSAVLAAHEPLPPAPSTDSAPAPSEPGLRALAIARSDSDAGLPAVSAATASPPPPVASEDAPVSTPPAAAPAPAPSAAPEAATVAAPAAAPESAPAVDPAPASAPPAAASDSVPSTTLAALTGEAPAPAAASAASAAAPASAAPKTSAPAPALNTGKAAAVRSTTSGNVPAVDPARRTAVPVVSRTAPVTDLLQPGGHGAVVPGVIFALIGAGLVAFTVISAVQYNDVVLQVVGGILLTWGLVLMLTPRRAAGRSSGSLKSQGRTARATLQQVIRLRSLFGQLDWIVEYEYVADDGLHYTNRMRLPTARAAQKLAEDPSRVDALYLPNSPNVSTLMLRK